MNSNRRKIAVASAAVPLVWLTACASTPAPTSIVDTARRTPQLSTLSKLINDAGLADTLRGAGPFTLFAPSDDAFRALPAKTLADLSADAALLKSVLSYHVVPGNLSSRDAKTDNLKTVQGANIAIAKAGNFVTVEDAVVQQADVAATNGVLHVIDKVLMPPKR
ncbi:MAG TPA: fasciclin domain-containing protein [Rubrivivax sp.]|nr:fasciclin domain-containing protein [Rubrivivax sp.]